MKEEDIIQYYDHCEVDYRIFWDLNHSHAMHAGYWDQHTKNLRDALRRENEVLAEIANIKMGDRVLDAGCGVGGSSIFLAKKYSCEVVGITLSEKQVQTARRKARAAYTMPLPSFQKMDYTCTSFQNESFDVVWCLESACHAESKEALVKEASRLLKKGGRLIVADGFFVEGEYSSKECALMQRWLKGWGVTELETVKTFENHLLKHHFNSITFRNITSNVIPSARRLYLYSLPGVFLSKMGEWMRLRTNTQTENLQGARCHYQTLRKGLWLYGIFCAVKK